MPRINIHNVDWLGNGYFVHVKASPSRMASSIREAWNGNSEWKKVNGRAEWRKNRAGLTHRIIKIAWTFVSMQNRILPTSLWCICTVFVPSCLKRPPPGVKILGDEGTSSTELIPCVSLLLCRRFTDECTSDEQCADDEVCCPASRTCEPLFGGTTSACGEKGVCDSGCTSFM